MTEHSYWWTTGGAGDGASTYTRADLAKVAKIIGACNGHEGVAAGWLNVLSGSVPGANTARIATGGALVDGKPYDNDANVDVTIASAVGGGNTRIDRIVLRADWTAQTVRITRVAGVDAASPAAPSITQTPGTTYDVLLYQALVNTSGTVTLTDERTFGQTPTNGILNDAVTNAKLRDASALSVIGRSANSSGDPADIAAGTEAYVLRRLDNQLLFGLLTAASIADLNITEAKLATGAVTTTKIADLNVTTGKIANGAVDDTKVGDRVAQFYRRQGGHATDWSIAGTSPLTPGSVRMQAGVVTFTFGSSVVGTHAITFPDAFSAPPIVLATRNDGQYATVSVVNVTASGFTAVRAQGDGVAVVSATINWMAIGPE